jgi:aminoglycoside phosphotransferase (APT) family kinase protein
MKPRRDDSELPLTDADVAAGGDEHAHGVDSGVEGVRYGLTDEEYQAITRQSRGRREPRVGWSDAQAALSEVLRSMGLSPARDILGRVEYVGEGLSNVVFGAAVRLHRGRKADVVIKLRSRQARGDRDARIRSEAALLRHLQDRELPFNIPRPVGEVATRVGLAAVQEWVDGFRVNFRMAHREPWTIVASVAAAIHAIAPLPPREALPFHSTRREHAARLAAGLTGLDEPEARDTAAWIGEHLPPDAPASLLHGDLLGQNVLWLGDDTERFGVIDWAETCVGDPAYDLAIVTRGSRKPFASADGFARLLGAYNELAVAPLKASDVRIYELILHAGFFEAAVRDYGRGSPHAENQRKTWQNLLRRSARMRA